MTEEWCYFVGGVAALAYLQLAVLCVFILIDDYAAAKQWGHRNTNLPSATARRRS